VWAGRSDTRCSRCAPPGRGWRGGGRRCSMPVRRRSAARFRPGWCARRCSARRGACGSCRNSPRRQGGGGQDQALERSLRKTSGGDEFYLMLKTCHNGERALGSAMGSEATPALIAVLSNAAKMSPAHGDRERGTEVSLAVSNADGVTSSGQQCSPEL